MKKSNLKLLTLIPYKFLPAKTGGELAHLYFHNYIAEYLDDFVVGNTANKLAKTDLKFNLISVFKNRLLTYLQLPYIPNVILMIKKEKIDIIMCSHPYLGIMSYIAARWTGKIMISYSHNIESERFKTLGKWWSSLLFYYEKWVLRASRITFFVTEEDRLWGIKNYKLNENQTRVSPFGINLSCIPSKEFKYKDDLRIRFHLAEDVKILYFVGGFPYEPNNQAVDFILHEINPRLERTKLKYRIFIVGKNLSEASQRAIQSSGNIIYLGFVDNIREILDSADIMLNPMLLGGGIKTKAVEALGNNIKVVSTQNGSFGINPEICQGVLFISKDNDWDEYTDNILKAAESDSEISSLFYEQYYWGNVTKRVVEDLEKISI